MYIGILGLEKNLNKYSIYKIQHRRSQILPKEFQTHLVSPIGHDIYLVDELRISMRKWKGSLKKPSFIKLLHNTKLDFSAQW